MLYSLSGLLSLIGSNFIVVNCSGVGYKCLTSSYTQSELQDKIDKEILVYTYMNVRQDAIDLFGFSTMDELECFKLLTSVSGVGSKAGLAILSQFTAEKVGVIVSAGDSKSLTSVSGIGAKTAQRIVLELKDKLISVNSNSSSHTEFYMSKNTKNVSEAMKALTVLGYSNTEVTPILSKLDTNLPTEKIIQQALKFLARGV